MLRKFDSKFRMLAFLVFGLLLQQLVHHILEKWYIGLLLNNFNKYSLGLSWDNWFIVHHVMSFALVVLGLWFGYKLGKKYSK